MKRSELTEFAVEEEGFKLKIRRGTNGLPVISNGRGTATPFPIGEATPSSPVPQTPAPASSGSAAAAEEAGITYIKSPMVGTFYRAASPDSKPFAEIGAKVV